MRLWHATVAAAALAWGLSAQAAFSRTGEDGTAGHVLLEPVRNASGEPLVRNEPDGTGWPVLKPASSTPVTEAARKILATGLSARISALDQAARKAAPIKAHCPALPEAVFILLSDEDGGYARHGFHLQGPDGRTSRCNDHFIDLTADEASIASGEFEEVLAHEWGHVLLRRMWGPVPPAPSRKFHSTRAITDPMSAFDEGLGIALQPLSARMTETPGYAARTLGMRAPQLADMWFSRQEGWLRQTFVPQNMFAFEKRAPAVADPHARWLADEAAFDIDPCRLKSGNQMVASEAVVASFLHKLLAAEAEPLEARHDKLLRTLSAMGGWPAGEAPVVALVRTWGTVHPAEREAVTRLFLQTTHGATASASTAALAARASCAGASGDIGAFMAARKDAQVAQDGLLAAILEGRQGLGDALKPGIWIANDRVRVSAAPWQNARTLPAITDLNSAREAELELLFQGTALAGLGGAFIAERQTGGAFPDLAQAASRLGLAAPAREALLELQWQWEQLGPARRK
ncbi:hypothetical protein ACUJ46_09885 [Sandaracinobacteroides sp. A072]|uniref:hypothetical protein n=1 Tax=Sandaracinobacteroides sp. A072 TaxID=3461146 RepID=UPI004040EEA8